MAKPITIKITGDDSGFRKTANGVERRVGKFEANLGPALGKIGGMFAGAFAAQKLIDFGAELFELGGNIEAWNRRAATVFGEQVDSMREWSDQVNERFGMSEAAVLNLASSVGDLLVPMGFQREQAALMSQEIATMGNALSEWTGGTIDAAAASEVITKAMLGETDGLVALGVKLSAAEIEQRALELAQKDGREEITQMDKALATQELILERSSDAMAAYGEENDSLQVKSKELKAKWEDLKVQLAEKLLPVFHRVTEWILEDFIPAAEDFAAWFQEDAMPVLEDFGRDVDTWIIQPLKFAIEQIDKLVQKAGGLENVLKLGGKGGIFGAAGFLFSRAEGGPVSGGRAHLVGEEGPEIFKPRSSGVIIPNPEMGGGAMTVNVTTRTNADPFDIAREVVWAMKTQGR